MNTFIGYYTYVIKCVLFYHWASNEKPKILTKNIVENKYDLEKANFRKCLIWKKNESWDSPLLVNRVEKYF